MLGLDAFDEGAAVFFTSDENTEFKKLRRLGLRQAGRAGGPEAMMEGGAVKGAGMQGTGVVTGPFRAHHGSISRDARLQLERALKDGSLPALVGTSSLELGIDIGE